MHIQSIKFLFCSLVITSAVSGAAARAKAGTSRVQGKVTLEEFKKIKTNLLQEEIKLSLGGRVQLNEDEKLVNNILMKLKNQEYEMWYKNPGRYNFSQHYFTYRDQIEKSQIYQIIKRMPKGAALHVHSTLTLGAEYMLKLTYADNLYICQTTTDIKFLFASYPPIQPCPNQWTLLSDLRSAGEEEKINQKILNQFSFNIDPQHNDDINVIWNKFNRIYYAFKSIITFRPIREKFIYDMFQAFYDDNVMYLELRSGIHQLYELNGTQHDGFYMVQLHEKIGEKFKQDHPDFMGFKLIVTRHRSVDKDQMKQSLEIAKVLQNEYPHLFAGFDMVGQEDLGRPLHEFLPDLIEVKDEMNFYFHGGETNWSGLPSDDNLFDAILLGSKRIGHAYSLVKHPLLMRLVIQNNIALEVNVISNAVLALVGDVRNHPLSTYLALDLPVVLSSDDPGAWGAAPLSHDFYVAFLGVANKRADLRMLKQLAINSIIYSSLDDDRTRLLMEVFNKRWIQYLKDVKEASEHITSMESV